VEYGSSTTNQVGQKEDGGGGGRVIWMKSAMSGWDNYSRVDSSACSGIHNGTRVTDVLFVTGFFPCASIG